MPEYDDNNTFVLFPNPDKKEGDNRPSCTGKLTVEGVEYKIAAWTHHGKTTGRKFLSGKVEVEKAQDAEPVPAPAYAPEPEDDSVPF